jgi:hypothetical protein
MWQGSWELQPSLDGLFLPQPWHTLLTAPAVSRWQCAQQGTWVRDSQDGQAVMYQVRQHAALLPSARSAAWRGCMAVGRLLCGGCLGSHCILQRWRWPRPTHHTWTRMATPVVFGGRLGSTSGSTRLYGALVPRWGCCSTQSNRPRSAGHKLPVCRGVRLAAGVRGQAAPLARA